MQVTQCARALVALTAMLLLQQAQADGFDMFSRHEELQNHVIVDTGDFEKISPPPGKLGVSDVLKLKSNCFEPIGILGIWSFGKKAGLVLVGKEKNIKVALLDSGIGSIKVQVVTAIQVDCPTATSDGLPADTQQRLQELRRRQEAVQKELERLRQQK